MISHRFSDTTTLTGRNPIADIIPKIDDWPSVSNAFVEYLQRKFPDQTPMKADSLLELGRAQGQREVVQFIELLRDTHMKRGQVLN